jgi:hypothetical protein
MDRDRSEFRRRFKRDPTPRETAAMNGTQAPEPGDAVISGRRRKMGFLACEACALAAKPLIRKRREAVEDKQEVIRVEGIWVD